MFSQLVEAARGLFVRPEFTTNNSNAQGASGRTITQTEDAPESQDAMVTATRRSMLSRPGLDSAASTPSRGSPAVNGKRKSSSTLDVQDSHTSKRRKKPEVSMNGSGESSKSSSPGLLKDRHHKVMKAVEIRSPLGSEPSTQDASPERFKESVQINAPSPKVNGPESKFKPTHVRFGSEEPVSEPVQEREAMKEKEEEPEEKTQNEGQDSQEESDEDDAPEAVSNVAQLQQLKEQERKRQQAKQKLEQMKKEKRREHEKRLQSQAAASKPRRMSPPAVPLSQIQKPKHDEIMSESSATLQGSDVKPSSPSVFKSSLPLLLPDEILNAEPTTRPPTPPRERQKSMTKTTSNKIRFLDAVQKPPKDIRIGNTSVRVLDGTTQFNSRTGANNRLAPKASKASKSVKESWMAGHWNRNVSSGLRRTTGGTSGFVRK
ncbi:hypothetical protein VTO42DRAFT_8024 [Malbranchea cinnamomea]